MKALLKRKSLSTGTIALLLFSFWTAARTEVPGEWPQWRGPNRDGISKETGLLKQWPSDGPPRLWKTEGLGNGYSTVSICKGRIYTLGLRGNREFVIALDAADGRALWVQAHGGRFSNDRGDGPRGTPTVDGDRVYALGGNGDLSCLEAASGKIVWSLNVLRKFGGSNIHWGISESPLVLGDRLLVNAGGPNASVVALNKKDGSLIWKSGSDRAGYSSAIPLEVAGIPQAVFFTHQRALAVDVRNGNLLWDYAQVANRTANIATPIIKGNRVFLSSDYGTGCALLEIKADGPKLAAQEIYFNRNMKNHHSSSVLIGDTLYGFSSAILTAMRFDDGEVIWKDRSVGKGSLVFADGHLYCFSEKGVMGLVEASPRGYQEKGRFSIPQESLPTWSHPVVAGGRLYLRDQDNLYAFDVREKK
ncbi:MAG: PQQ-like beta-propeller repeat protein [Acidobacteria bacterium]|nr:PQQ-like beta-propeller repeat protein [Acidobacteriota bacterium]